MKTLRVILHTKWQKRGMQENLGSVEGTECVQGTEWYVVGIECLVSNGPMPCSRQLRLSLYSGAVITEGLV